MRHQNYLFICLAILLLGCGENERPEVEISPIGLIETYGLNRQECTGTWQSTRIIGYNITKNEVTFAEPTDFSGSSKDLVIQLEDDKKWGPSSFEKYTTLFIEVGDDTIFIQTDILGLNTFDSCKSHYVKL